MVIFFAMIPYQVKAYNICSTEDTVKLNKLASNVLANYSYYETDGVVKFKITINNLSSNTYIYDAVKKQTYYSTGEITLENYGPNQTVEYKIYSNIAYCKGQYLNSIFVTLPPYNPYYKDKLCSGIEDYKLCQKWSNVNLTYDEFKQQIYTYRNDNNEQKKNINDNYKSIYELILDFYIKYYYIILPLIIVVGGIILAVNKQKSSKDEF